MSGTPQSDHTLVRHEEGRRILGVAAATGKVIELKRVDESDGRSNLVRLENGQVTHPSVYNGSPTEVGSILDGMIGSYWLDMPPMPAKAEARVVLAPAVPAHAAAPHPAGPAPVARGMSVSVLALSAALLGASGFGYLAYRENVRSGIELARYDLDSRRIVAAAPLPTIPSSDAPAAPAVAKAPRPATAPPKVALPGSEAPAAPMTGMAQTATAEPAAGKRAMPVIDATPAAPRAAQRIPSRTEQATLVPDPSKAAGAAEPPKPAAVAAAPQPPVTAPVAAPAAPAAAPAVAAAPAPGTDALADRSKAAAEDSRSVQDDARKELEKVGPEQAQQSVLAMQQVYDLLSRSDKISPALARQLPHELAQKLKEAGAIQTPEEAALGAPVKGRANYRIVRLSPEVYDKLKDKDGTPTVPDSNSWAATGGNVPLPLPGGGDIKGPDDLRDAFHLQP